MTKMAGRMLIGMLSAKKVMEGWEKLCDGFDYRGLSPRVLVSPLALFLPTHGEDGMLYNEDGRSTAASPLTIDGATPLSTRSVWSSDC
jgi:hypothetical protein